MRQWLKIWQWLKDWCKKQKRLRELLRREKRLVYDIKHLPLSREGKAHAINELTWVQQEIFILLDIEY